MQLLQLSSSRYNGNVLVKCVQEPTDLKVKVLILSERGDNIILLHLRWKYLVVVGSISLSSVYCFVVYVLDTISKVILWFI